jgi:O-antigen biosynthesis protein
MGGLDNIIIFSHPVQIQNDFASFNSRKDILFVGSFLAPNGPNDDAILHFVKEVWPEVQKQLSCKLFIVGINPPDNILKLASESIIVTGFVADIKEYYNNCRVFIVSHRYAAGIPLKLIEAMSYGIPAVVSELIASQLNLQDGKEVLIAHNSNQFVEKIVQLYQNPDLWNTLQMNSFNYIKKESDPEKLKGILNKIVNTIQSENI